MLFKPSAEATRLQRENPAFLQAWPAQGDEFAALDVWLSACQRADLTQAQVAELMGSSKRRWRWLRTHWLRVSMCHCW
jgi:hypothetical protein